MCLILFTLFMKIHLSKKTKKIDSLLWGNSLSRIVVVFLAFFMSVGYANAQTITVKGNVIDTNNEPVIGATVKVVGTTTGTATDIDGNFTINAAGNAVLEVSYIGYSVQKIPVNNQRDIKIVLEEDLQNLEEVVVVAYGTQKKATLTGAISAIGNKELVVTKSQNTQNLLTGKLPGVRVVQKTSEPGNFNNQFDIRGLGSPLIIVDGVPRDNFERMDPNDIESISILKDASAAIYGVHSANGVVLISTKKGQKGKTTIEYSGYYGLQFPAEILRPVGTYNRMILVNDKKMRSDARSNMHPIPVFSKQEMQDVLDGKVAEVDWYDAVLRPSAPQQQHNISASGGTDKVDYYMNIGYMDQEGFFKSKDMEYSRYNIRSNISAEIVKGFKIGLNLAGSIDKRDRQHRDAWDIFSALWRSVPTSLIYANNNPNYYRRPDGGIYNAVAETYKDVAGYRLDQRKVFQSQGEVEWDIPWVKGLSAKAVYSYDLTHNDNSVYLTQYNTYLYDQATEIYTPYSYGSETSLERTYNRTIRQMGNIQIHYSQKFLDKHNVDFLALYEEQSSSNDNFYAKRYLRMKMPYLFVGEADGQVGFANSGGISDYANKSIVARINYDYANKYLFGANFRRDGSSHFLPDKQWDNFYSFEAGWRLSEEGFIKNNFSFVDNLKIRGTWGRLGQDSSNLYEYLDGYNYPSTGGSRENGYPNGYFFGSSYVPTMAVRGTANKTISWLEIYSTNIGIDLDIYKGLFGITAEVFQRTRDGLYARRDVELPATFGSDMPQENLNGDLNKGFELELRHRNRINGISYGLTGNVSITRHMRTTNVHTPYNNSYSAWRNNREDRYSDIWWGYGIGGRYQSLDEINRFRIQNDVNALPGDYYYEDWNNDGVIDSDDYYPIATTTSPDSGQKQNYPLMYFALNGNLQYKGFDFDFMFQGAAMSYVGYGNQLTSPLAWDGNALSHLMDRWHPADVDANPYNPSTVWVQGEYGYGGTSADGNSRFMIQNGAYVRLKTATLGYTLPQKLLKTYKIQDLRFYVNGYNLFTITGVKTVDPEKSAEQDGAMYPLNRTVNFGVSVKF
jgi:TonB-linked outer membrane protein, SusC/RagA family